MNDNKGYSKWNLVILVVQVSVLVVQVIIAGVSGYLSLEIARENQQLLLSSRRADISIFVDWYEYLMTTENITLTVYGSIHNEGSRATVVKNMSIGIRYISQSGNIRLVFQLAHTFRGAFAPMIGWQNLTLMKGQMKTFALTESYDLTHNPNLIHKEPDEGVITVFHDDYIGVQEQTKTFSLKYFP